MLSLGVIQIKTVIPQFHNINNRVLSVWEFHQGSYRYECTATRGISFPSPPSAGVSTRSVSGHWTDGIEVGP